jgi:hypothetical protein
MPIFQGLSNNIKSETKRPCGLGDCNVTKQNVTRQKNYIPKWMDVMFELSCPT